MPLIFYSNTLLLSYKWSTTSYSCPRIIICESVSAILVSPPKPKVVATVDGVVVAAFGGILFDSFYRNLSSNYVTEPSRKYYGRFY